MSNYYQPYPSNMAGAGASSNSNSHEAPFSHQGGPSQLGHVGTPVPNPYQSLGYFTGFPDPIMFQAPRAPGNRTRKKSTPGMDTVKHRRTRSGCYTCRSRRVKCDETHPICDRCRKGKRECVYPEAPSTKGTSVAGQPRDAASTSQATSPESSVEELEESDRDTKLEPIIDVEGPGEASLRPTKSHGKLRRVSTLSSLNLRRAAARQNSETPSLDGAQSASPALSSGTATSFSTTFHASDQAFAPNSSRPDWSHLPGDLQAYLGYYCEHITHYSYCMVNDPDDFFGVTLPSLAVQSGNDALLYAVVGFSAYQRTIENPKGKIHDFLRYYNKSVTLLLSCLKRGERRNTATLVTILQLATIEEYLGDWVNLMGHQKAALEILTGLFTPETIMEQPTTRILLTWYARFDVFVAMMAGFETTLPRMWLSAAVDFSQRQADGDPSSLVWKIEAHAAALRLISVDMSILYARGGRGEIPRDVFASEHAHITDQLCRWKENLDPAITDPKYLVSDFAHSDQASDSNIVDPRKSRYLYNFPLFQMTILMVEWHSILVMHKSQESPTLLQQPSDELRELALTICELFESIELWPSTPNGALVTTQACLAIAALFVPRDEKHHTWIRRKYALLEALGYVFPVTMRARMAEIFRDPSCYHWWLPNDEGLHPIIRSIRAFAEERNGSPGTPETENLREMSAIFAKMRLDQTDWDSSTN
ncbi:hypothetical protein F4780DRAFT_163590 [Xylariomycetidae sp. FL0641]|nr:hypothetical protein F4780DRAFT_163590 [Xylariomycetidae sp. FL0641]